MRNLGDPCDMEYYLEKMCRHVVDLSHGRLLSINTEFFGTDDLLITLLKGKFFNDSINSISIDLNYEEMCIISHRLADLYLALLRF